MKEYFYELDLASKSEKTCHITAQGFENIEVTSAHLDPSEHKNKWTPEHLMAAAISSRFMTTFLETAQKNNLQIIGYTSHCFIKLEKKQNNFSTTEILIRPTIRIPSNKELSVAIKCLDEADQICTNRNIINIHVNIHPQFLPVQ